MDPLENKAKPPRTVALPVIPVASASRETQELRTPVLDNDTLKGALEQLKVSLGTVLGCPPEKSTRDAANALTVTLKDGFTIALDTLMKCVEHRYMTDGAFRQAVHKVMGPDSKFIEEFGAAYSRLWKGVQYEASCLRETDAQAQDLLFSQCGAIQLTQGCSIGCSFCGVGAPHGVRMYFSYNDLHQIAVSFAERYLAANATGLYYASEPFDWRGKLPGSGRALSYPDAHTLFSHYGNYQPYVATAVPDEKLREVLAFKRIVQRVSVSFMNEKRLRAKAPQFFDSWSALQPINVNPDLSVKTRGKLARDTANNSENGIGCFNGVLLTPEGFFNVVQVAKSAKYINRQVVVPIDVKNLNVSLPEEAVPIEELLKRGIVQLDKQHWGHSQHLTGRASPFEVRNLRETRYYIAESETGLCHPVSKEFAKLLIYQFDYGQTAGRKGALGLVHGGFRNSTAAQFFRLVEIDQNQLGAPYVSESLRKAQKDSSEAWQYLSSGEKTIAGLLTSKPFLELLGYWKKAGRIEAGLSTLLEALKESKTYANDREFVGTSVQELVSRIGKLV